MPIFHCLEPLQMDIVVRSAPPRDFAGWPRANCRRAVASASPPRSRRRGRRFCSSFALSFFVHSKNGLWAGAALRQAQLRTLIVPSSLFCSRPAPEPPLLAPHRHNPPSSLHSLPCRSCCGYITSCACFQT